MFLYFISFIFLLLLIFLSFCLSFFIYETKCFFFFLLSLLLFSSSSFLFFFSSSSSYSSSSSPPPSNSLTPPLLLLLFLILLRFLLILLLLFLIFLLHPFLLLLSSSSSSDMTSSVNVEELVSMSSSLPVREKICEVSLKAAKAAGTKLPIWAMICSTATCFRYVDLPLCLKEGRRGGKERMGTLIWASRAKI